MASVVEYKGLKAGYYCGYCQSREGKASCGECSLVRPGVAVTVSRKALAMSRQVSSVGRGRWSPDPSFLVPLVASPSLAPSHLGLPASPTQKIAAPHRGGTEIAASCP